MNILQQNARLREALDEFDKLEAFVAHFSNFCQKKLPELRELINKLKEEK